MTASPRVLPVRSGRGGQNRSKYNVRGENLERILVREQGRRYEWLLAQLRDKNGPEGFSRPTLYRARLPEDHPLYIDVTDAFWIQIARVLNVHPSAILGTAAVTVAKRGGSH